jgi:hypothetical protein
MKISLQLFFILFINLYCYSYHPMIDNILCIVNYNYPHYNNIALLKEFYGDFFPNMVFYGPTKHEQVHQINHQGFIEPGVILSQKINGFYGYKDIADAMRRYPNYDGYLFTNDDCFINISRFKRLNPNKIWFIPLVYVNKNNSGTPWTPWFLKSSAGWPAIERCYKNIPLKYWQTLCVNKIGYESCWAMSDLVYFPAKFKDDVIYLCDFFENNGLWLEIAIPHLCACIENQKEFELLKALYSSRDLKETISKYDQSIDFVHPIKLSIQEAVDFVKKQLKTTE